MEAVKKIEEADVAKNMDIRLKRIEGYNKIFEGQKNKKKTEKELVLMDLDIEYQKITNNKSRKGLGYSSPVETLMAAARAWYINNGKTVVGSEPCIESLWDDDEMAEIKFLIMEKLRKL